jgi:ZIP family zinc transporter
MWFALGIALLASLATSIGGFLATHKKIMQRSFLAVALAFSAGAMLFVSFVEILPLGITALDRTFDSRSAQLVLYGAFFVGIGVVMVIDRLLPKSLNPAEIEGMENVYKRSEAANKKLLRSGALVAFVLALHNFPEGMSTFFATYQNVTIGVTLAIAIAIHNIPEGIAVAAPVYAATKSRAKAFWWATLSGVAEFLGALGGVALVHLLLPQYIFGILFGLVAGMMVFLAIDELLPAARRYQSHYHQVVYGLLAGMGMVALSLLLF